MEEKNYERTRKVLTKGVKEWIDDEYITNPLRSWDSIQKTAYEIWKHLELDSALNQKPNGDPIFYLNADDPNKLLEIGPNKTVGDVAVSLEGQIIAAVNRGNIKYETIPSKTSRHSHKPSENVWYKVEFDSTLEHIDYWWTKYTDEGCPEKGKPFFRNAKGNLSNWPRGLTSVMKEDELIERAEKAKKEKEKRDKEKKIEDWIKGRGDGTGTKEGFILCQKHSQLVEEIKTQNPKRVEAEDWGFIERTVKSRLHAEEVQEPVPEVKQATRDDVLGTEESPTEILKQIFKEEIADARKITIIDYRCIKSENYVCYLRFELDGHPLQRSTRTKDKRRARAIVKEGKKMFSTQEPAKKPEVKLETKPEPKKKLKPETKPEAKPEAKPSFAKKIVGGLKEAIFGSNKPETMGAVTYFVKVNNELVKDKDGVLEITERTEEKAQASAFVAMGGLVLPRQTEEREKLIAEVKDAKARLAEIDRMMG